MFWKHKTFTSANSDCNNTFNSNNLLFMLCRLWWRIDTTSGFGFCLIFPSFYTMTVFCWWLSTNIISSCHRYLLTSYWSFHSCLILFPSIIIIFYWDTVILVFNWISSFSNSNFLLPLNLDFLGSSFHFMLIGVFLHKLV